MDFINHLRLFMNQNAFPYSGEILFNSTQYIPFNSNGLCKNKCCRYRIFSGETGAHLYCWRRELSVYFWHKEYKKLSEKEKHQITQENKNQLKLRIQARMKGIILARKEWDLAHSVNKTHPYIIKKRIVPYEAKQLGTAIILPVYNQHEVIVSNQKIYPAGEKRFLKDAPIKGGSMVVGEDLTDTILFCEGWATACSLHEATNLLVVVSFSASNFSSIAPIYRKRCPHHKFIFCADVDKHGVGIEAALSAVKLVGGMAIEPSFLEKDQAYTDFNDLSVLYGNSQVYEQLKDYL